MAVSIYALADPRTRAIRYVGKAVDARRRLREHLGSTRSSHNNHLLNWLRQLPQSPELLILARVPVGAWQEAERMWIQLLRDRGEPLTNRTPGGEGASRGAKFPDRKSPPPRTEEYRRKLSTSLRGRIFSEAHRAALSRANRKPNPLKGKPGKKHTEASKKKISDSKMGHIPWNKGRVGAQTAWNKGKACPQEVRDKISMARKRK